MLLVRFYVFGRIRSLRYVPQSKTDQERVDVEFTMQTGSKKMHAKISYIYKIHLWMRAEFNIKNDRGDNCSYKMSKAPIKLSPPTNQHPEPN